MSSTSSEIRPLLSCVYDLYEIYDIYKVEKTDFKYFYQSPFTCIDIHFKTLSKSLQASVLSNAITLLIFVLEIISEWSGLIKIVTENAFQLIKQLFLFFFEIRFLVDEIELDLMDRQIFVLFLVKSLNYQICISYIQRIWIQTISHFHLISKFLLGVTELKSTMFNLL